MPAYNILYIGKCSPGSTTGHRMAALVRLGHRVEPFHENEFTGNSGRWTNRLHYHTGYRLAQSAYLDRIKSRLPDRRFEIVWVDSGWWCGPRIAEYLRTKAPKLVMLNNDDPTGPGYGLNGNRRWASLRKAIPLFDLCVIPRTFAVGEYRALGARDVLRRPMGYDEVAHHPDVAKAVPAEKFCHQVVFIGTRMEDRHELLLELVRRGVPLSIYGNGWVNKAGWDVLRRYWCGNRIERADYVAAIRRSCACLGLLSKGNRDGHTQRSAEVPFAGGVLCAQRTAEHAEMYVEDEEAVFWSTPDECAEKCLKLVLDEGFREAIRARGRAKVQLLGIGNEATCAAALERVHGECRQPLTLQAS